MIAANYLSPPFEALRKFCLNLLAKLCLCVLHPQKDSQQFVTLLDLVLLPATGRVGIRLLDLSDIWLADIKYL